MDIKLIQNETVDPVLLTSLNDSLHIQDLAKVSEEATEDIEDKFIALKNMLGIFLSHHQEASIDNFIFFILRLHPVITQWDQVSSHDKNTLVEEFKEIPKLIPIHVPEFDALKNYQSFCFGNLKLREGWVFRKDGFSFNKIYLVLTKDNIIEYINEKKVIPTRIISFKRYQSELQFDNINLISVTFPGVSKLIQYRIDESIDLAQWTKCFQSVLMHSRIHIHIIPSEVDRYFNNEIITENQLHEIAESGDLLLFETSNMGAKIQRMVTQSRYDHVAIILRVTSQYISIFDSNADTGVSLVEWNTFVEINDLYSKVVLRKLMGVKDRVAVEANLFIFLNSVHGKKYQVTAGKLFKQRSISPKNKFEKFDDEGFFCSELVAKAYKKCKLLQSSKACGSFWPVDYGQDKQMKLTDGYLDREITVVLNKHCKKQ